MLEALPRPKACNMFIVTRLGVPTCFKRKMRCVEAGQDEDRGTSLGICSRMFERITEVINSMLRYHPRLMGPHCYGLLRLYLDHCLLVVSAADVQNMRPKRLQHMVRLIGFCLLLADSPSVLRGKPALQ